MLWTGQEIGSPERSETERPLAFRSRPPCALDLPNSSQKSAHLHQLPGYLGEYRLRLEFKLMVHKLEQTVWTQRASQSCYFIGVSWRDILVLFSRALCQLSGLCC